MGFPGMGNYSYQVENELRNWDLVVMDFGEFGPRRAQIYRYKLPDTENREVLADSVFGFYEIKASHDGRYIAYLRNNTPEGAIEHVQKIAIYDLKDNIELKTDVDDIVYHSFTMAWSPNENNLLITNRAPGLEKTTMRILSVETMQVDEILEKSSILYPEWSSDGTHISFMEYQSFDVGDSALGNIVDVSTGAVTTITDGLLLFSNLKWSGKGNRLFFVEIFDERFYLSSISPDGSDVARLIKGRVFEPDDHGSFPGIIGPLPVHDRSVSVYPNGDYLNVHNFGFISDNSTYRVLVDVNNQRVNRFLRDFVYHSNVLYAPDGRLSYKRGKYEQETFPHVYVSLPNGNQLTQLIRTLASGGEVLVPKF